MITDLEHEKHFRVDTKNKPSQRGEERREEQEEERRSGEGRKGEGKRGQEGRSELSGNLL